MSNSDAIFDKASERTLWSCIDREGGCRAASLPNSAALAVHFPPIPFTEHKWPGSNYAERRAKLTRRGTGEPGMTTGKIRRTIVAPLENRYRKCHGLLNLVNYESNPPHGR